MSNAWEVINYIVDFLFLCDIILIFNSGFYNDDAEVISNRAIIAWNYIRGWFLIDLVAIIPFEAMFSKGESTNLVRYTRIGRLNKMFKLMKLLRLTKLNKGTTMQIVAWL